MLNCFVLKTCPIHVFYNAKIHSFTLLKCDFMYRLFVHHCQQRPRISQGELGAMFAIHVID